MEKQSLLKALLLLVLGGVVGYTVSNITSLSIYELKTPMTSQSGNNSFQASGGLLATFDGSWILVSGTGSFNDINSVAVHCFKDKMICNVAEANVLFNDLFTNTISYFNIKDWSDKGQITAENNSLCDTKTLKADVNTKNVTLTEVRNSSVEASVCPIKDEHNVLNLGQRGF